METNTLGSLVFLVSIGFLFVLILARQIPLQLIGRGLGTLFRPITRLFGKSSAHRALKPEQMGPSAWAALTRATRPQTDTEVALGADFVHEDKHLTRNGLMFHWISVVVGYMRIPAELTADVAEDYYKQGSEFLNGRVPIVADPQNLYEDEEGALIAKYFPADRGCFYLLNQMRRTINSNVRKLTVVFSAIIATVLVVNLLYNTGHAVDLYGLLGFGGDLTFGPVALEAADINQALFAILSTVAGAIAMWLFYFVEYVPYQRNNFRELSNFVTRYLARLNDHFRTASGQAKSVTVGQETDASKFAHSARKWHTNVLWISLRIFFIESFMRNIIFQMLRNSGYYLVFVPLLFLVTLAGVNLVVADLTGFNAGERLADLGVIFIALFFALIAVYVLFLRRSMASIDEVNQDEWIGFDSLLVENVLGEIVGKYAEDVGYWKNRIGGSF